MEEYDQDEWKKILKSYAKLEAAVKDENDDLDSGDKVEAEEEEEEEKEEVFWDFIYKFKYVLTEKRFEKD